MNWVWRRLSTVKWQDAWEERLRFAAERMAVMRFPNSSTIRVEVYCEKLAEAELLKSAFGGTVQRCPKQPPQAALVPARTQPLRIRGKLLVVHSEKEARAARREGLPVLLIPGGMAFGTGEHATTSTCLRLLCDAAARRKGEWSLLDLGTGTGILALAAKLWGAKKMPGLGQRSGGCSHSQGKCPGEWHSRCGFSARGRNPLATERAVCDRDRESLQ